LAGFGTTVAGSSAIAAAAAPAAATGPAALAAAPLTVFASVIDCACKPSVPPTAITRINTPAVRMQWKFRP
jgi:hypothetical protein